MRIYRSNTPEGEEALRGIIARRNATNENALRVADEMIAGVRATGDMYVAAQVAKFDRVNFEPSKVKIVCLPSTSVCRLTGRPQRGMLLTKFKQGHEIDTIRAAPPEVEVTRRIAVRANNAIDFTGRCRFR